jgi:hypothetical protein
MLIDHSMKKKLYAGARNVKSYSNLLRRSWSYLLYVVSEVGTQLVAMVARLHGTWRAPTRAKHRVGVGIGETPDLK